MMSSWATLAHTRLAAVVPHHTGSHSSFNICEWTAPRNNTARARVQIPSVEWAQAAHRWRPVQQSAWHALALQRRLNSRPSPPPQRLVSDRVPQPPCVTCELSLFSESRLHVTGSQWYHITAISVQSHAPVSRFGRAAHELMANPSVHDSFGSPATTNGLANWVG